MPVLKRSEAVPSSEGVVVITVYAGIAWAHCVAECGGWELRATHLPQLSSSNDMRALFHLALLRLKLLRLMTICFCWLVLLFFFQRRFVFISTAECLCHVFVLQEGAILVFLPGWDNISSLNDLLTAQQMFRSGTNTQRLSDRRTVFFTDLFLCNSKVLLHFKKCFVYCKISPNLNL